MGIELLRGDCLEVMPTLASASIDLVLCDPPFAITQNKWDTIIPLEPMWAEYRRLCKGAIVLFAAQPFTSVLVCSNLKGFKYQWVWEKSSVTGHLNAHKRPMRTHEDILVWGEGTPPYYPQGLKPYQAMKRRGNNGSNFGKSGPENWQEWTNYPRSILRFDRDKGKSVHPTQKPIALLEYLIRTYTNPGDTVLDNCMGSGSTGVACVNTGRNFVGIERDPAYFKIAQERLREARVVQTESQA